MLNNNCVSELLEMHIRTIIIFSLTDHVQINGVSELTEEIQYLQLVVLCN